MAEVRIKMNRMEKEKAGLESDSIFFTWGGLLYLGAGGTVLSPRDATLL